MKLTQLLLVASFLISPLANADDGKHYYFVNQVFESEQHLLSYKKMEVEKYLWWLSAPGFIGIHYLLGEWLAPVRIAKDAITAAKMAKATGSSAAIFYGSHALPIMTSKTWGRLYLPTMMKAKAQLLGVTSSLPAGTHTVEAVRLTGSEMEIKQFVVSHLKVKNVFLIATSKPLPDGYLVSGIEVAPGQAGTFGFTPIENLDDLQIELYLADARGPLQVAEWPISLAELKAGVRIDPALYKAWYDLYKADTKEEVHIDMRLRVQGEPLELGTFVTNFGMNGFFEKDWWGTIKYFARRTFHRATPRGAKEKAHFTTGTARNPYPFEADPNDPDLNPVIGP